MVAIPTFPAGSGGTVPGGLAKQHMVSNGIGVTKYRMEDRWSPIVACVKPRTVPGVPGFSLFIYVRI